MTQHDGKFDRVSTSSRNFAEMPDGIAGVSTGPVLYCMPAIIFDALWKGLAAGKDATKISRGR